MLFILHCLLPRVLQMKIRTGASIRKSFQLSNSSSKQFLLFLHPDLMQLVFISRGRKRDVFKRHQGKAPLLTMVYLITAETPKEGHTWLLLPSCSWWAPAAVNIAIKQPLSGLPGYLLWRVLQQVLQFSKLKTENLNF